MMRFQVDDVRAWYEHVKKMVDGGTYKGVRVKPPEEIGDTFLFHVWDPSGILLIFVQ